MVARPRVRQLLPLVSLLVLLLPAGPAWSADGSDTQQRLERLVQILDYVGVDYAGAVKDGEVINAGEYGEMEDFVGRARELAQQLPQGADREALLKGLEGLGQAVESRADPATVRKRSSDLEQLLLARFPVKKAPASPPDMARGKQLFQSHCASCHGAEGRGDGPQAAGLQPPPTDFHDEQRVFQRSPFGFFTTITHGLDGTAMSGFGDRLSAAQRWDLAFYVASIPFDAATARAGKGQLRAHADEWARRVPGLSALATTPTENLLEQGGEEARPVVALLRRNPSAVEEQSALPLAVTRTKLAASHEAYQAGQFDRARGLAVSAYLDGFEPLEPRLDAVDHQLRLKVEGAMTRYRGLVGSPGNGQRVGALYANLKDSLETVGQRLESGTLSAGVAFVTSFGILLREGLEALL
ncbi:MAG TPA: c-type cytochrome, partial [Gammaproteobacteria bacterium]|nr:c-type cytochrome [Gammaproteobacteria bacterium]